ncbi:MAG: exodeoxyribonuclease VII small subunit [bacterium]|jgi:exodeoxyribonuclease VII small subunit
MTSRKKFKDFETALARLEEITARLESGDSTLEEAIALYTEGMEIAAFCTGKLAEAEKKIVALKKIDNTLAEVPFETESAPENSDGDDEN